MITICESTMGSGKTLTGLALAKLEADSRNVPIYSNLKLKLPNYKLFRFSKALELKNCVVLLDSAYYYCDSMRSASSTNLNLGYALAQSGKAEVSWILTTPRLAFIDRRIRLLTEIIVRSYRQSKTKFVARSINLKTGDRHTIYVNGPSYWNLYDSTQIIRPISVIRCTKYKTLRLPTGEVYRVGLNPRTKKLEVVNSEGRVLKMRSKDD